MIISDMPPARILDKSPDNVGKVQLACFIVSAWFKGEPDVSHYMRLDTSSGMRYPVVSISTGGDPVILSIRPPAIESESAEALATMMAERLSEAEQIEKKMRWASKKCLTRLNPAIKATKGDFVLQSLQMAPHPVELSFAAGDFKLEARIAGLGDRLQPAIATLTGVNADEILSMFNEMVPEQRRRVETFARFQTERAVAEIDVVAEAAFAFCRHDLLVTTKRLLRGEQPIFMEGEDEDGASAQLHAFIQDGRLKTSGHLTAGGRTAGLDGDVLQLEAKLSEGELRELKGDSAHLLFPHPMLAGDVRISSIEIGGETETTDLWLQLPVRLIKMAEFEQTARA